MSESSSVHLTTLFPERLLGHLGFLKINNFKFLFVYLVLRFYVPVIISSLNHTFS